MWNNWQLCSAGAPRGLPALLISRVPTQTQTPLLLWLTEIHFYFIFNTVICSLFDPRPQFIFFFLITGIYFILNWKWVISTSSASQSTVDCRIPNSLKGKLLWPSHFLPRAFISFEVLWCEKSPLSFLPAPRFQSNFLFCDKLVISICWNIICYHLLLHSALDWQSWNATTHDVLCCSPQWLLQEQRLFENSGKSKFIQEKYRSRGFQLEIFFSILQFSLCKRGSVSPTPSSHFFWSHSPKIYQAPCRREGWALEKLYFFIFLLNQSCSSQGLNNTSKACGNLKSTLWRLVLLQEWSMTSEAEMEISN